jgi:hypothetical protein
MRRAAWTSRRGTAAVGAVIALVLLQLVIGAVVISGGRDQDLTARRLESVRAQYAAEAAANMAIREVAQNSDGDGDGTLGSIAANSKSGLGFNGGAMRASASVSGTTTTTTATGTNGQATRKIQVSVRRTSTTTGLPGLYGQFWALTSTPANIAAVNWNATPLAVGVVPLVHWPNTGSGNLFVGSGSRCAIRLTGKLDVPTTGTWTLFMSSDDGSIMWLNGTQIINNDGPHGIVERSWTGTLTAGLQDIEIRFYDQGGSTGLWISWAGPGVAKTVVPTSALRCTLSSALPAIAADASVSIWGDGSSTAANVDGFDSSSGAYGGLNVLTGTTPVQLNATGAATFQMTQNATVYGNVLVGPGGNPSTVITTNSGSTITGTRTAATSRAAMFRPGVPTGMPASAGAFSQSGTLTLSSNARYSSFQLFGNGTTLTVTGHVILQVDGAFSVVDAARILINTNSSLTIFCSGTVSFNNQAEANTNTGDPSALRIFMTGSNQAYTQTDRTRVYAWVNNPLGPFNVYGQGNSGSEFWGMARANTVVQSDKTKMHGDARTGATSSSASTAVLSWAETP